MYYDPKLPLTLATDASPVGLGVILSHKIPDLTERPIAYASRTLTVTEKKYSHTDKEVLSITWGIKKILLYLKGRKFTLITNQKPLVAIFGSKKGMPVLAARRLLHYSLALHSFQFDIIYRKTNQRGNANFLSRLPTNSQQLSVQDDVTTRAIQKQIKTLPITAKDLAKETETDAELSPLLRTLQSGGELKEREMEYTLQDGCIVYGQRFCIPKRYRENVLKELHHGHLGTVNMNAIARSDVFWNGKDIENTSQNCSECTKHKLDPKVNVHHWEYPTAPMERIHIDYAGHIFEHMFLIIADAHSEGLEAYPMKSCSTFRTIECLRDFFARIALPLLLVSDNGPQIPSHEFEFFRVTESNTKLQHRLNHPIMGRLNGVCLQ
ncbi:uncharacterized protein K02A2.6-like [Stegodyphus dumicola]|uniref:uncharacterized protein K02A2.6-like n=1 Tax=Stegodyphus dumicola TaxID=202533 RepID=UPI0015A970FD|nr:uncharacterized protein K02A2.6-like [Stegodyphus dumicola]